MEKMIDPSQEAQEPSLEARLSKARNLRVPDLTGRTVSGYDIKERLGQGGSSVVYRAVDPLLQREVAFKVLVPHPDDPDGTRERFEAEARSLARLDHPSIMPIYQMGKWRKITFLIMPLMHRGNLRQLMRRGAVPWEEAKPYLEQLGQALDYLHSHGLVHCDPKPSNILIREGRAVLADFGLSRPEGAGTKTASSGYTIGTPGYMAPEQASGQKVDRRSDIYSLAVIAFEMLTGTPPYRGDTPMHVAIATVRSPIPSASLRNPVLPPSVDDVFHRGLAKQGRERPVSAAEFLGMLERAITAPVRVAEPERLWPEPGEITVFVDNECPYCQWLARRWRRRDKGHRIREISAQEALSDILGETLANFAKQHSLLSRLHVVDEMGKTLVGARAWVEIRRQLPGAWRWQWWPTVFPFDWCLEALYWSVSSRRVQIGRWMKLESKQWPPNN